MTTLNAGCVTWRIPIGFLMLFTGRRGGNRQITDGADVCSVCALRASRRGRAMWQMPVLFAAPVKQSPGFVLRISDIQEGE